MKKVTILLTLFLCLESIEARTQNNVWSLPPNYLKNLTILPLPTPSCAYCYNGHSAYFTHNAMQDASGNLLFFIVDDSIYDSKGYLKYSPSLPK